MPQEMQIHQASLLNKLNGYLIKLRAYAQKHHIKAPTFMWAIMEQSNDN